MYLDEVGGAADEGRHPAGELAVEVTFDGRDAPGIYNAYFELIDNDGAVILDNIFSAVLVK